MVNDDLIRLAAEKAEAAARAAMDACLAAAGTPDEDAAGDAFTNAFWVYLSARALVKAAGPRA